MKFSALIILIYALLVCAGGVMGYARAQSVPSIIFGLIFGTALLVCGWSMWQGSLVAHYIAGALALLLALFFGYRFFSSGQFMPGGLMLTLSLVILSVLGLVLRGKE